MLLYVVCLLIGQTETFISTTTSHATTCHYRPCTRLELNQVATLTAAYVDVVTSTAVDDGDDDTVWCTEKLNMRIVTQQGYDCTRSGNYSGSYATDMTESFACLSRRHIYVFVSFIIILFFFAFIAERRRGTICMWLTLTLTRIILPVPSYRMWQHQKQWVNVKKQFFNEYRITE